jgi:hypothetical protein
MGNPPYPFDQVLNPYAVDGSLEWTVEDWDPALRFWTLPYDQHLTEWLQSVDPSLPSILAAREFGGQPARWQFNAAELRARNWLEDEDLEWQLRDGTAPERNRANTVVRSEIEELQMLMQDDRERYLAEADMQADGVADYFIHFLSIDRCQFPWTVELIACGLAIGNLAYMYYKAYFKRVRASFLCPGLVPPFGPPRHPSFPSGHSFLGHLIPLLLLEVAGIAQRFGIFAAPGGPGGTPNAANVLAGRAPVASPLLWLGERMAKNRERMGFHYASDSSGSRHIAAGIWWALLHEADPGIRINCPTLRTVLRHAQAEWP